MSIAQKHALLAGSLVGCLAFWFLGWDLARHQLTAGSTALMLLAPFLAAAAGWFAAGYVVRPLRAVESAIEGVGEGQLDPVEIPRTGDEVQLVAQSLNAMIEALRASESELREEKRALEERMHERTEALGEATERALAASRAKSDFLANISHELRTPMNGVLGMLDLLLDENPTATQREYLVNARNCANSLLALLNDLLDLSKIEAGKMLIEHEPFEPRQVVEECVATLHAQAQRKGIVLRGTVGEEVPARIIGDPLRLRQILMNLLGNAVKFTTEGWVAVTVTGTSDEIGIEVRDTGEGIPASKLANIFEAFVQADSSVSRKFGGTGLGLFITRRLVELQSGKIGVESEVGIGTTFRIQLPMA
ncbi:MAG: ATP-binding protein, partial [Bryobacteraceae bacterium]